MNRNPEEEIYQLIRGQFKAAEKHVDRVKELIRDHYSAYTKLNRTSLLLIMKQIRKDFKREDWPEVKYMFKSIFVYIISDHKPHLHLTHISQLIASYPEFADADEVEKSLLLQFRNLFNVACEIIDPKNHKGELIALVGRMCGAIYVTGGGQTTATDRRVLLYERETGIAPRKQPERKRRADDPATISLAALHQRSTNHINSFSSNVPMPNEINPMLVKRPRFEAADTQSLLRSADSFWNYHRDLMEAGDDIPFKTVPADQAYASFAYPSHDLPFTIGSRSTNPAAHPSMRFLHDPLRRPQMPMSMQMQLPPARPMPLPAPLPLSMQQYGISHGSGSSHLQQQLHQQQGQGLSMPPLPPSYDYQTFSGLLPGPAGHPQVPQPQLQAQGQGQGQLLGLPGQPAPYGYYGQTSNGDRARGPSGSIPGNLTPHSNLQQMPRGQGPSGQSQGQGQGQRPGQIPVGKLPQQPQTYQQPYPQHQQHLQMSRPAIQPAAQGVQRPHSASGPSGMNPLQQHFTQAAQLTRPVAPMLYLPSPPVQNQA